MTAAGVAVSLPPRAPQVPVKGKEMEGRGGGRTSETFPLFKKVVWDPRLPTHLPSSTQCYNTDFNPLAGSETDRKGTVAGKEWGNGGKRRLLLKASFSKSFFCSDGGFRLFEPIPIGGILSFFEETSLESNRVSRQCMGIHVPPPSRMTHHFQIPPSLHSS